MSTGFASGCKTTRILHPKRPISTRGGANFGSFVMRINCQWRSPVIDAVMARCTTFNRLNTRLHPVGEPHRAASAVTPIRCKTPSSPKPEPARVLAHGRLNPPPTYVIVAGRSEDIHVLRPQSGPRAPGSKPQ